MPSTQKRNDISKQNPGKLMRRFSAFLAAFSALFVLIWLVGIWREFLNRGEWREFVQSGSARGLADAEKAASRPENLLRLASIYERNAFPPDYQSAAQLANRAILEEPLNSSAWIRLARYRLFQGEQESGLAALERSGELDPGYPVERLHAIRLWQLAGKPRVAAVEARRLASLGPLLTIEAIEELQRIGLTPLDISSTLELEKRDPEEYALYLDTLLQGTPAAKAELMDQLPDRFYKSKEFRREAAPLAARPILPGAAARIWKFQGAKPVDGCGSSSDTPLLAKNLNLGDPAFSAPFFFGWQKPREVGWVQAGWINQEDEESGRIRLTFYPASKEVSSSYRWLCFRLFIPAETPLSVGMKIERDPSRNSSYRLFAIAGRDLELRGSFLEDEVAGVGELALDIPELQKAALVEITLERRIDTGSASNQREDIYIGPMSFHCGKEVD